MVGILLFLTSTAGYKFFMQFRLGIREEFTWVTSFSWMTILVYFFSLFGALTSGIFIAFIAGIICFILELVFNFQKISQSFKKEFNLVNVFFLCVSLLFMITISQLDLRAYDDFSHWGTIVKFLASQDRLPQAGDSLIAFKTYPPASALFIRYCLTFFGYGEGRMLLSQFIWIAAAVYALTGLIKHKNSLINLALFSSLLPLFNYYNQVVSFNTLLVDFLMPVLGLALLAALFKHRQDPVQSVILLVINGMALAIVKNNAIYFLLLAIIFFIYQLWQANPDLTKSKKVILSISGLVLPFISLLAWDLHTDLEFGGLELEKHSMSPENYAETISEKSILDIFTISRKYIGYLINPDRRVIWAVLLFIAIFAIFAFIEKKLQGKSSVKAWFAFAMGQLFAYLLGIYLMYLFSMPLHEALRIAAVTRYVDSILVYTLGITYFYVFEVMRQGLDNQVWAQKIAHKHPPMIIAVFLLLASLLALAGDLRNLSQVRSDYAYDGRAAFYRWADESFKPSEEKVLIGHNNTDGATGSYLEYVGKYHLFTPNVQAKNDFSENPSEFIDFLDDFDFILLLDEDAQLNQRFNDLFGFQLEEGVYPVEDLPIAGVEE